jgi:hypothetical protein
MSHNIINVILRPFRLAITPKIGLVLKGSVDEVRNTARRVKLLRVGGVEIIGREHPIDPSCAFLAEMQTLQFVRLFAGPLTDIEVLSALTKLRYLKIEHTRNEQSIPIDFGLIRTLENVSIEWFHGADSIFRLEKLKSLNLRHYPESSSESLVKLHYLTRLYLASCALIEIEALRWAHSLAWLALLDLDALQDFSGILGHPAIRFLWIERCSKLRDLESLRHMNALETLRILDCGEISGIHVLRSLPRLRHIHIHGSIKVTAADTSFLRDLPNLESVVIKGLPSAETAYWKRRNKRYDLLRADLTESLV